MNETEWTEKGGLSSPEENASLFFPVSRGITRSTPISFQLKPKNQYYRFVFWLGSEASYVAASHMACYLSPVGKYIPIFLSNDGRAENSIIHYTL